MHEPDLRRGLAAENVLVLVAAPSSGYAVRSQVGKGLVAC